LRLEARVSFQITTLKLLAGRTGRRLALADLKRGWTADFALALLLAAPCIALADKKSSSRKDTPTESVSFNYGKIEQTYIQQRTINPTPKLGANGGSAPKGGMRC
jgi:type VI protein secretion system component Hcp